MLTDLRCRFEKDKMKIISMTLKNVKKSSFKVPLETFTYNCADSVPEVYTCAQCNFKTLWRVYIDRHINLVHKKHNIATDCDLTQFLKVFKCSDCGERTNSRIVFIKHQINCEEKAKVFKCSLCAYSHASRKYLQKHNRKAHPKFSKNNRSFQCEQCPFRIASYEMFTMHVAKHLPGLENMGQYNSCDNAKATLNINIKEEHPLDKVESFKCEFCALKTTRSRFLEQHILEEHCDLIVQEQDLFCKN